MTKRYIWLLLFSISLLMLGVEANWYSSGYIDKHYANLPLMPDLVHKYLPYHDLSNFNEIAILYTVALLIIFIIKNKYYSQIPYYLFIFAIFQLLRALFIVLTPMGNPCPGLFGISTLFPQSGMFPSGHTSIPILAYYLVPKLHWLWRMKFLALSIIVVLTMLISRGHYTIDIIATIFMSYTIVAVSNKHVHWWFTRK